MIVLMYFSDCKGTHHHVELGPSPHKQVEDLLLGVGDRVVNGCALVGIHHVHILADGQVVLCSFHIPMPACAHVTIQLSILQR